MSELESISDSELSRICMLVNELQRVCYQLRFLSYQQRDLDNEWLVTEQDEETIFESIVAATSCTNKQLLDAGLLSRQSLINGVNFELSRFVRTRQFRLHADPKSIFNVLVDGAIENYASVDFLTCKQYHEVEMMVEMPTAQYLRYLFLPHRDFGRMHTLPSNLGGGEVYGLGGDEYLSAIFWPYLIPLDGTCFCLNGPMESIIDVEISEK